MSLLIGGMLACSEPAYTRLGLPSDDGSAAETGGGSGTDSAAEQESAADSGTGDTQGDPPDSGAESGAETGADTGTPDPCAGAEGSLDLGEDWDVEIDDFTGDEATTEPKEDANDGRDGDNPYFQRVNVARAHCSGDGCYWYTSSHQESGEPDPGGTQYVDYRPPFASLGVGWYDIQANYRQSDNRASYEAVYEVHHRDGTARIEHDQREGSEMESLPLGRFWMCPDSFVRVEDEGSDSITMNAMDFSWDGT